MIHVILLFTSLLVSVRTAAAEPVPPKLILQITVDQLRADLPERFLDRMGEGGFRYLLERGVVFKDAHPRAREHGNDRRSYHACNGGPSGGT